ncbi:MAG: winged helix family transcriptional regulator, partial [Caldilineae bacterium]
PLAELAQPDRLRFWRELRRRMEQALPADTAAAPARGRDPAAEFDALEERLEDLFRDGYERIIFVIDDFDLVAAALERDDLHWLRSLVVRFREHFALVIASVDPIRKLTEEQTRGMVSPFYNVILDRRVGLLTAEDAAELVRRALSTVNARLVREELVDFLLQEAGRHPDLLRRACLHTMEVVETGVTNIDELQRALRADLRYDDHARFLFERLLERRTEAEKQVLMALALGQPVAEEDTVMHLARHLELVERRGDSYVPFANAFAHWLRTYSPPGVSEPTESQHAEEARPPALPPLVYDPHTRTVQIGDAPPKVLSALENKLLAYLLEREGEVCPPEDLLANVWPPGRGRAVVEKTINRLRGKIEPDSNRPVYLLSRYGQGYLLRNAVRKR